MTKRLSICLLAALLALCGLVSLAQAEEINLLANGSFEMLDGEGMPDAWYTDQWIIQAGYTVFGSESSAHDGESCAFISNFGMNDARFAQVVQVEPETLYCLSGWIRVEDVSDAGWGANLSIEGLYSRTEGVFDADGEWHYVELYGETSEDQYELTVLARLGGYSGESEGMAWFDGLCLRPVDETPGDLVADMWFVNNGYQAAEDPFYEEPETNEAKPAWPWLTLLAAVYTAFGCLMIRGMARKAGPLSGRKRGMPLAVAMGLVLSFLLRHFVATLINGYQVDVNCFLSWGATMNAVGPTQFYQTTSFCDYPPAYVYVMGFNNALTGMLRGLFGGVLPGAFRAEVIMKLIPMLCDVGIAALTYYVAADQGMDRKQSGMLSLLMAFNPMLVLNSAAWGQIDCVLALLLMAVAYLAIKRRWQWLMPVYMLAVLTKPQALMLGFLGLLALVVEWIRNPRERRRMLLGVALAAVVAAVIVVPFSLSQPVTWIIDKYAETLSSYAYASVNAANLYYLTGHNWQSIAQGTDSVAAVILALFSLGWGVWNTLRLRSMGKRLWQLEASLGALFTIFFVVCAIGRPVWSVTGYGAMALAFAIVLPLYVRGGKLEHLPLLGGVLFLLLFSLGIKMHERYLFPALALLAMAFAVRRDWRTLVLLLCATATMFVNSGIVLDNSIRLGSAMGHLNNDTRLLNQLLSLLNVALVAPALWTAWDVCMEEEKIPRIRQRAEEAGAKSTRRAFLDSFTTDPSLHWKRLDSVLVLAVTAVYAVLAFWNLGSTRAPQTVWTSSGVSESVVIDLGQHYDDFSMVYYAQVSYNNFTVEVSDDGETWSVPYWAEMAEGLCFRWKYLTPSYVDATGSRKFGDPNTYPGVQRLSGRYVRITSQQIGLRLSEVIFRQTEAFALTQDAYPLKAGDVSVRSGALIPAKVIGQYGANLASPNYSDGARLLDEQDSLEGEPGWFTGTYFDEIYHARTAYEHLHGERAYETTHPPLGKVIMSWGVAIFGMTPFGWRFMGALMGVLMLPGMYLLAKQLTKRTSMGFAAMLLMALDTMHYTQTRIATIDSFPVVFIIFSYFFMLRFIQRDLTRDSIRSMLPDLALSGFFMGCAMASKWIGVYAGAGLAVLFFWTCARHVHLSIDAIHALRSSSDFTEKKKAELRFRADRVFSRIFRICLWCLLFFVAVPVAIYLLSYIPHLAPKHPAGLIDYLKKVWEAQETMLGYHSTPRLGMDHPFYSPWYEWPFNVKPMYYAMAYFMPEGMSLSIFCFTNPVVTLPALAALCAVTIVWAKRHIFAGAPEGSLLHACGSSWDTAPAFVLLGLLAQYLPWVLVPRGTYIYHYFASLPFLILGTVLCMSWLMKRGGRKTLVLAGVYLALCLAAFIAFFPYASGMPTPVAWLDFVRQFLHVYHS